jgi:hypothetical protein
VTGLVIQHLNVGTGMITPMKLMKIYLKLLSPLLCQIHTIMIQTWYTDTGATSHMTYDKGNLQHSSPL